MSSWPEVCLADLLIERRERIGDTAASGRPLLGVSNRDGIVRSDKVRISDMSRYLCVELDWLAYNPMRINVGSIGWAKTEELTGVISPDYVVFSCNDRVHPGWVLRFLASHNGIRAVNLMTGGSVRDRLYFSALAKIKIPLPVFSEQCRILGKLEEIEDKICEVEGLNDAVASGLNSVSRAAISDLFPKPNGAMCIGDIASLQGGYAFKSGEMTNDGIRLVRNVNIGHGQIDWCSTAYYPTSRESEFSSFALEADDILISLNRPIISTGLKAVIVRPEDCPSFLVQRVARFRFKTDRIIPAYWHAWLHSGWFLDEIGHRINNGVPYIPPGDISSVPVSLPSIIEQRRILAAVDALANRRRELNAHLQHREQGCAGLRLSILSRAFAGSL